MPGTNAMYPARRNRPREIRATIVGGRPPPGLLFEEPEDVRDDDCEPPLGLGAGADADIGPTQLLAVTTPYTPVVIKASC